MSDSHGRSSKVLDLLRDAATSLQTALGEAPEELLAEHAEAREEVSAGLAKVVKGV